LRRIPDPSPAAPKAAAKPVAKVGKPLVIKKPVAKVGKPLVVKAPVKKAPAKPKARKGKLALVKRFAKSIWSRVRISMHHIHMRLRAGYKKLKAQLKAAHKAKTSKRRMEILSEVDNHLRNLESEAIRSLSTSEIESGMSQLHRRLGTGKAAAKSMITRPKTKN